MAEEDANRKTSRADEIAELKRQMEEMQKRLEQLSAAADEQKPDSDAAQPDGEKEVAAPMAVEVEADELAVTEAPAVETTVAETVPGPAVAVDAPEPAVVEAVPVSDVAVPAACDDADRADAAYTAAAVADFMPQSTPPQPAPPVYGAPQGYAGQQQSQQPYAQQPGQTAYYQQNAGYYSAPQGGYAQPQGGYQTQYQQPLVRTKDHVAAGLLAIFLGVFGVHKFYLGYNTAGFILLGVTILGGIFTLGIAASVVWLIGIIEGVMYLTKSQPEFEQTYVFGKREWF